LEPICYVICTLGGDETHCAFVVKDIEADHATLRTRGVGVDAEIARAGNCCLIVQPPTEARKIWSYNGTDLARRWRSSVQLI
jgi:hypothetical protein